MVFSTTSLRAIAVAAGFMASACGGGGGESGSGDYSFQAAAPTFSPPAGTYGLTQQVTIASATPGASIFYTTDGSTPTTNSPPYSSPVPVSGSATIRAIATCPGYTNSGTSSAAYVIDPVVLDPPLAYHVDSVNGNDANPGTLAQPLRSIAALLAKGPLANSYIWLARGSYWREQLSRMKAGTTIRAYGPSVLSPVDDLGRALYSDRPMFDAANVATNANFTKTGGYTNVYQMPWAHQMNGTGKVYHRVWENGTRLTRASSLANCDATAGSFYAAAPTAGPDTVYVHPSGDTNPASDGKVYEFAARNWGVNARDSSGVRLYSVAGRRNGHADGSVLSATYASDAVAEDGVIHDFWNNGTCDGCMARFAEPAASYGASTLFVAYTDNSGAYPRTLPEVLCRNCTIVGNDQYNTIGFYSHAVGGGSITLEHYENCSVYNVNAGFSGGGNSTKYLVYNGSTSGVLHSVNAGAASLLGIIGGTFLSGGSPGSGARGYDGHDSGAPTVIVYGARFAVVNPISNGIWVRGNNVTSFTAQHNTIYSTTGGCTAAQLEYGPATYDHNLIAGCDWVIKSYSPATIAVSDYNLWAPNYAAATPWGHLTSDYQSLAFWKAGTGLDANSVAADAQFTGDPSTGVMTVYPSSPAVTLGAGADVPFTPTISDKYQQLLAQ